MFTPLLSTIDLPTLAANAIAAIGLLVLILGLTITIASVLKHLGIGNAAEEDQIILTASEIDKYAEMAVGAVQQVTKGMALPETPLAKFQTNLQKRDDAVMKLLRDVPGLTTEQAIDYVEQAVGKLPGSWAKWVEGVGTTLDPTSPATATPALPSVPSPAPSLSDSASAPSPESPVVSASASTPVG